jgi:HSP20 family molecular chaperone IbpA
MIFLPHAFHPLQGQAMACHPRFSPLSGHHVMFLQYPHFDAEHCRSSCSSSSKEAAEVKNASLDDKERATEHPEAEKLNAQQQEQHQLKHQLKQPKPDSTSDDVVVQRPTIRQDESSTGITMTMDVAGYSINDLEIQLDNRILTISGRRRNRIGTTFVFQRCLGLKLDRLNMETLAADLTEGVLEITVQKKDIAPPGRRVIPISTTKTTSNGATLEPILNQDIEISHVDVGGEDESHEGTTTTDSNTEDSDRRRTATPVETVANEYDDDNEEVEVQQYVANTIQDEVKIAQGS